MKEIPGAIQIMDVKDFFEHVHMDSILVFISTPENDSDPESRGLYLEKVMSDPAYDTNKLDPGLSYSAMTLYSAPDEVCNKTRFETDVCVHSSLFRNYDVYVVDDILVILNLISISTAIQFAEGLRDFMRVNVMPDISEGRTYPLPIKEINP